MPNLEVQLEKTRKKLPVPHPKEYTKSNWKVEETVEENILKHCHCSLHVISISAYAAYATYAACTVTATDCGKIHTWWIIVKHCFTCLWYVYIFYLVNLDILYWSCFHVFWFAPKWILVNSGNQAVWEQKDVQNGPKLFLGSKSYASVVVWDFS